MSDLVVENVEPNVDVSCWFNGMDFVMPVVLSINEDRCMEGNLGQTVDSMGCVLYAPASVPRVFKDILLKLKPLLRKVNYCGFMTIACLLKKDGYAVVKLIPYFKYDLLYAFFAGVQEELGRALHAIATGEKKEFRFPRAYSRAVRITIPPFPYTHTKSKVSTLNGFCPENERHIWLQNAETDATGQVISTSGNGVVATVTARGVSVRECRRRVYRTMKNLSIEDMQYRRDIGAKAEGMFDKLKEWKWI
jgi:phosphoribosylamine--glycine ligase